MAAASKKKTTVKKKTAIKKASPKKTSQKKETIAKTALEEQIAESKNAVLNMQKNTFSSEPKSQIEHIVDNFDNHPLHEEKLELPEFTIPDLDDEIDISKGEDIILEAPPVANAQSNEVTGAQESASPSEPTEENFPKDPSEMFKAPEEKTHKKGFFGAQKTKFSSETGFLSGLFKKKEENKPTESIETPEVKKITKSQEKGFKEDTNEFLQTEKDTDHIEREKMYVENLKRRTDNEFKERMQHVQNHEKDLAEKHEELLEKDRKLSQKEIELAKKDDTFLQLQQLQEEVENQKISLEYQKQQIEELKTELALKDNALREKEIELDRREEDIKQVESLRDEDYVLQKENVDLHQEVEHDEDEIAKLEAEIQKQRDEFEKEMQAFRLDSTLQPAPINDNIQKLITAGYIEISQGNISAAKIVYNKLRDEYNADVKSMDTDKKVYNEILKLYKDISSKE